MTEKYDVTATKKDGTAYHGLMTTKELRITKVPVLMAHRHISHRMKSAISDTFRWLGKMKWSPEQTSGWLRRTKQRKKTLRISPETIYKTLYFRSREESTLNV